jgi:hypothetical protein
MIAKSKLMEMIMRTRTMLWSRRLWYRWRSCCPWYVESVYHHTFSFDSLTVLNDLSIHANAGDGFVSATAVIQSLVMMIMGKAWTLG